LQARISLTCHLKHAGRATSLLIVLEAHAIVGSKLGKAVWHKQEMAGSTIEPGH